MLARHVVPSFALALTVLPLVLFLPERFANAQGVQEQQPWVSQPTPGAALPVPNPQPPPMTQQQWQMQPPLQLPTGQQPWSQPLFVPPGMQWPAPVLRRYLGVSLGPVWDMVTPSGVHDDAATKLGLEVGYGYEVISRPVMSLAVEFPVTLQANTKAFYENSFFAFKVGLSLSMKLFRQLWVNARVDGGLGTGFAHRVLPAGQGEWSTPLESKGSSEADPRSQVSASQSQTGLAMQTGVGVKLRFSRLDLSFEPLGVATFSAFGPGSFGAITSWRMSLGAALRF